MSLVQREQVKEPLAALVGAGTSQLELSGPHGMEDKHCPPDRNSSKHKNTTGALAALRRWWKRLRGGTEQSMAP